jgi:hypothetical protein
MKSSHWVMLAITLLMMSPSLLFSQDPKKPAKPYEDADKISRLVAARREYQQSLIELYRYYEKNGDRERARWAEEELRGFHLANKMSFRVDVSDVPQEPLEAKVNDEVANELYKEAMKYKERGTGTEYILNQRRAEILLQEILQKHKTSDKIADVAYQLGELYEGRAFKQYERAAAYFEKVALWKKGSRTDARLRAAYLYDKVLNERSKAIELYRDEIKNDTDSERIKFAEARLAELTSGR